ncbi:hypothetical protein [Megasphaera stantonii]|uniref:Uncharacterized protein n=1 Tax=Megasphaera stantonii TaxID=2144175 RepID=A0A346B146_9FIRM|nr:hypothetical protein [Megasphaera stantonii]AXL21839.1 hypothetical protein DKB62_09835 [Megasphaera stantonii]
MSEVLQGMNIKSVKYLSSSDKVVVNFENNVNGSTAEIKATYSEPPRPEFAEAFEALRPDFTEIFEFSQDVAERVIPYAVSVKTTKNGALQATISAKIYIEQYNSYSALNTPMLVEMTDENSDTVTNAFPAGTADKIRKVLSEAYMYITGKRAQMSLFEDEEDDDLSGGADEMVPASGVHTETARSERIAAASDGPGKASFN